jgi:hypothetical protein
MDVIGWLSVGNESRLPVAVPNCYHGRPSVGRMR